MLLEVSVNIFKEELLILTPRSYFKRMFRIYQSVNQITMLILCIFFSKDEYQIPLFEKWKKHNNS